MKIHHRKVLMATILSLVLIFAALVGCAPTPEPENQASSAPASQVPESSAPATSVPVTEDSDYYKSLPYQDVLPLDAGEIMINGEAKKIVIGFSQTGFNHPWRVEMINAAKAEIERHSNVTMVVTDGNVDIVKQSGDIRDLISQGVDAIVMSPVESGGLVGAVEEATKAGIPVICLDRDVYTTEKTLFIGQSNITMGAAVAKEMVNKLTEKYGEPKGNILEITGLMGSSPAIGRQQGMQSVLKDYPNIKVLATGDGEWIREPAVKLMEDWLTAYPQIDAVFSHAEESSWGAILAIQRAGRQNENIMQFTMDASNQGFVSVKNQEFLGDGNYTPYIGQLGVRAALYYLMGKEIPGTVAYEYGMQMQLPDLPVVTPENAQDWIGKGWGDYKE